jgi:hypothetical protein
MPIHDWARVDAGVFHHFHLCWIDALARALNAGILPADYYALGEQHAAGYEPDVLALHAEGASSENGAGDGAGPRASDQSRTVTLLAPPAAHTVAEAETEFYRRKQNTVTVRHVSGDRIVAMVEVVSPGNKSSRQALEQFIKKAADLLNRGIHLLVIDLHAPRRFDPSGIHGALWDYIAGQEYSAPPGKALTLAAYESGLTFRAYVEPVAVRDILIDMPIFLEPGGCVLAPLEASYQVAWDAVPRRWKIVLEHVN